MLKRLHRTNAVLVKPENRFHRETIERTHAMNQPLIERFIRDAKQDDGRYFSDVFLYHAPNMVVPIRLFPSFLEFGEAMGLAWVSASSGERRRADFLPAFSWNGSKAALFFGHDMLEVVSRARPVTVRMREHRESVGDIERLDGNLIDIARRLAVGVSPLL